MSYIRIFKRQISSSTAYLYTRIGGRSPYPTPLMAHVQVDGSYGSPLGTRIACVIQTADDLNTLRIVEHSAAKSSTEAEWDAVEMGIRRTLALNELTLCIETDNLSVVAALTGCGTPKHKLIRYQLRIQNMMAEAHWIGIRWIPRAENHADDLFRV